MKMMSIRGLAYENGAMLIRLLSPRTRSSRNMRKTRLAVTNPIRHKAFGISQPLWRVADEFNVAPYEVKLL